MDGFEKVRVRIAPSPTGDPHVGLAYVALFNYIFTKQRAGDLILRIEDTDQLRSRASSEESIMASLKWLGLKWEEGPDKGGPYGPYRQSERRHIHRQHAEKLLNDGFAYRCFCTSERLDELRDKQKQEGVMTSYDRKCRNLSKADVDAKMLKSSPYVIRLKIPIGGVTSFYDLIRGKIEIENEQLDDQVLIKSDGFPTYHLANVVDDHLMRISHVMRAEEWISSTPKHILLYQAFGWDIPHFVHLPLLRNSDRSKISKRKNHVSLNYYRRKGILPKAMLNFLALMGWAYSGSQEIFSLSEMMEKFDIKDIHLGGPVFDIQKLVWMNQIYIQKMSSDEFADHLREEVFTRDYLKKIHPLVSERLETMEQFIDKNDFFFSGSVTFDWNQILVEGVPKEQIASMLEELLDELDEQYVWEMIHIQDVMEKHRKKLKWKAKEYLMPIRLVVTGRLDSPPLAKTMEVLGRDCVRLRLKEAIKSLSSL
ncbi:MAG: glutamate--tRNA ligase [Oligoflexales bacterium]|nr:glutamate--tRNA ligase [Oligoflexales bacterium]